MIKVKDGYAKLIGTTYSGSADRVLLSNGGDKAVSDFAAASGVVTALGTNGDYVTWTKNGTANNLTVPYATKSGSLVGIYSSALPSSTFDTGAVKYYYNILLNTEGLFPHNNNANSILTVSKRQGNYLSQLGFSSDKRLYFRSANGDDINSLAWNKIAYVSEIPTKVSQLTNDSGFVTGGPYLPLAGGNMQNAAVITLPANGMLRQTTATTSNATSIIEWYKGTTKDSNYKHAAQIGWHNTGNTDGAIYLVPHPTDTDPWASSVGLYIGKTSLKWNNQGLIHSGNIGTQSVAYATSAGNADTVDNKHASDFKYVNVDNYSYMPNLAFYEGSSASTNYYKLSITNVNNVWTMLYVEMSIKENYSSGSYGKIVLHVNKNASNIISQFTIHTLGQLSSSIKAYANNDSSSFDIYIAGNWNWPTLNVDRITFGDSAASVTGKNITLTKVTALPSSYSTASVITGIHSSNYNSYAPKLDGTGASGTWGINISGSADKVDGYHAGFSNNQVSVYTPFPTWSTLKSTGFINANYGNSDYGHPDEEFLKGICKWAIATYPNQGDLTLMGTIAPNSSGTCILHLYSSAGKDSTTSLPRYCRGQYLNLSGYLYHFGTYDYAWSYNRFAFASELKHPTNYYWANVRISDTSSTITTPTFGLVNSAGLVTSNRINITGTTAETAHIKFNRSSYNYITFPSDGSLAFGTDIGVANTIFRMTTSALLPETHNSVDLGTSATRWSNIYSTNATIIGNVNAGRVIIHDGTNSRLILKTASAGASASLSGYDTGGAYGADVVLNSGSALVLGAGESASTMYSNNVDSLQGSENLYLSADGYVKIFTNCDTIANRKQVAHFDTSGYAYFGSYINIGGHEKNASSPTYVWGSNDTDSFLRSYKTSSLSVKHASTSDYTNQAKSLEYKELPSSTSNATNTVWCKFARITYNTSAWCNAAGYFIFSGRESTDHAGILSYHFRAGSTATTNSIAVLEWLVKNRDTATVIAEKVEDNVYDLYINNYSTYTCPIIYHMTAQPDRFAWSVGSWTATKPTAAYTSKDSGIVNYATTSSSSTTVGDGSIILIPQYNDEINFGGNYNSDRVYFGYRAAGSKPIPSSFIFGGSSGSASITASKFIKSGGTSSQFLKADGSVDSNTYVTGGPYLPLSGGTLSGHLSSNSGYTIVQPYGAQYNTTTSSVTGCITVVLPASIGNSMVSMWIDVYVYDKQQSFSVHCGGYTYNNSTWANHPFAMVYGANHRVRMGHNGTNFVIYIGEESTTWLYPQVSVRNVTLGYSPTIANWQQAWDVVFSTSVSNVTYDTTSYVWTTKNLTKSSIDLGNVQNTAFYRRSTYVNGTEWAMAGTNSNNAFTIYAPTTAGTSGQVLTSSGGTPSWTDQSSLSVNNLNRLSGGFSVSGAGWYKLAYIKSTDARGSVRLALITTGGNYTPRYTELKVSNGWSTIVFNQNGKFDWISKYRYTTDSTYSYIEAYFTGACDITLYTFSGTGYVDDYLSGWQVYSAATAGSGTVAETYDHLTSSSLYTSGNFHTPSNAYAAHFYENSDANLKKNIKEILDSDNIPVIKEFDWKSDGTHSYGLIAQELEEQGYSELVSYSGSHKTVNYSAALSLIVGKLQNKIKELEKEIENLKLRN